MDMENPTSSSTDDGASTQSRLESFLAAEDTPESQDQDNQADAQQANDDTDQTDEPSQAEESPEYQLSDIAKLLGADESSLDVGEDGSVLVKTKIDGQEGKAKFQDLIKSYQLQGHVDKQVREAAEMRKAVEQQAQQIQQQMQVQQAIIGQSAELKAIESELAAYQNVDWNTWYNNDPSEASKASHMMQQLQTNYQRKQAEINQAAINFQNEFTQRQQQTLQAEFNSLLKAIPEWSDESKRSSESQAIQKYLGEYGLDTMNITDHRHMLIVRDAMLYRQSQTGKDKTVKAVRSAPKIIKPGSSQPVNKQADNIKQLHANVRTGKTGSVRDYLLATGKV
jgi:hypothetical protein